MVDDVVNEVQRVYRLRVTGEMGRAMREAFSDLRIEIQDGDTLVWGEFADPAALYSVFERLQALGLDLVDVAVVGDAPDLR
jgi:hypothetical protein